MHFKKNLNTYSKEFDHPRQSVWMQIIHVSSPFSLETNEELKNVVFAVNDMKVAYHYFFLPLHKLQLYPVEWQNREF